MNSTVFLILSISLVVGIAGCQSSAANKGTATITPGSTRTNTAEVKTSPTPANNTSSSSEKKEMASADLSDIDPGRANPAGSFNEKFSLEPDGWMGEKVAVVGLYRSHSTSAGVKASSAYRTDLKDRSTKTVVGCFSKERPAIWDDFQKNFQKYEKEKIVVRGVVAGSVDYGDGAFVGLEPCEIVSK